MRVQPPLCGTRAPRHGPQVYDGPRWCGAVRVGRPAVNNSKSREAYPSCGFDPHLRHHIASVYAVGASRASPLPGEIVLELCSFSSRASPGGSRCAVREPSPPDLDGHALVWPPLGTSRRNALARRGSMIPTTVAATAEKSSLSTPDPRTWWSRTRPTTSPAGTLRSGTTAA